MNNNPVSTYPSVFTFSDVQFVTLEATAAPGCQFDGWEGDIASTTNQIQLPVTSNMEITA